MEIFKHTHDMEESIYSQMSKHLGWDKIDVNLPTMEEVESLYERSKQKDTVAFYELLKINRFGEIKTDISNTEEYEKEVEILNLAIKYCKETQDLFRK